MREGRGCQVRVVPPHRKPDARFGSSAGGNALLVWIVWYVFCSSMSCSGSIGVKGLKRNESLREGKTAAACLSSVESSAAARRSAPVACGASNFNTYHGEWVLYQERIYIITLLEYRVSAFCSVCTVLSPTFIGQGGVNNVMGRATAN
jgi:hypothetical protein